MRRKSDFDIESPGKSKTNREKNTEKILSYLEKSKGHFFKNNPTNRKKLCMNFAEISSGTRVLVKQGIITKYGRGCYKINRNVIEKLKKSVEVK